MKKWPASDGGRGTDGVLFYRHAVRSAIHSRQERYFDYRLMKQSYINEKII